ESNGVPFRKDRLNRTPSLSGSTEPTGKTFWMPIFSFQSTRLNRSPINGLRNTTMIVNMKHSDIKPRQLMQHKGFFRHTPSGMVLKKKGDEQITALQQTTFRRENLSLAGCSSAEPVSVSVQQCKIQISKLYLQPVEIPSHFQLKRIFFTNRTKTGSDSCIRPFWRRLICLKKWRTGGSWIRKRICCDGICRVF